MVLCVCVYRVTISSTSYNIRKLILFLWSSTSFLSGKYYNAWWWVTQLVPRVASHSCVLCITECTVYDLLSVANYTLLTTDMIHSTHFSKEIWKLTTAPLPVSTNLTSCTSTKPNLAVYFINSVANVFIYSGTRWFLTFHIYFYNHAIVNVLNSKQISPHALDTAVPSYMTQTHLIVAVETWFLNIWPY